MMVENAQKVWNKNRPYRNTLSDGNRSRRSSHRTYTKNYRIFWTWILKTYRCTMRIVMDHTQDIWGQVLGAAGYQTTWRVMPCERHLNDSMSCRADTPHVQCSTKNFGETLAEYASWRNGRSQVPQNILSAVSSSMLWIFFDSDCK